MIELYSGAENAQVQLTPVPGNTGVKYPQLCCKSVTYEGKPLPLKLDYLTLVSDSLKPEDVHNAMKMQGFGVKMVKAKMGYSRGFSVHFDPMTLDDAVFTVYYGGDSQRGSMMFDRSGPLSGKAAAILIRVFGPEHFVVARVDIAADFDAPDFYLDAMSYMLSELDNWSAGGQRGRKPGCYEYNDKNTGAGSTFYIGSGDIHMLRLYEKGKQLKRKDVPNWVRVEVQYRPKGRPARLAVMMKLVKGQFLEIWQETPYVRFCDYLFGRSLDRIRAEQVARDKTLDTRALHLVKQYYGLMFDLVQEAHGNWDELGAIIQRYKAVLDEGQKPAFEVVVLDKGDEEIQPDAPFFLPS